MGRRRRPRGRDIDGIVLLDKPKGITSNAALQKVKRLFAANKAGHTGSLDPLASGLLPLCLGEATKISAYLLDADKHYWVRIQLGEIRDTGDADGQVIETRSVEGIDQAAVEAVLPQFIGDIEQVPPMYSAIHHEGKRLYELAREGVEVERKARTIRIHSLKLDAFAGDVFELQVHCSKGTYVRTLAEDIGQVLGCGAYVAELRRTGVDPFDMQKVVTLDELEAVAQQGHEALDAQLQPMEAGLAEWPQVALGADLAYYLRQGQAVFVPNAPTQGWVRLYDDTQCFIGVGVIQSDGKVAPKRLVRAA